jgi:hypothetical protein
MSFLHNDAVNRVNLHSGVLALAQGSGGLFFFVFLLHAGVSAPAALVAQALIVAGRFAIRPALLPLARRWGLKRLLIFGTAAMAIQYPLLAQVHGVGPALLAVCVAAGFGDLFYYLSFNAYFATVGDAEHRGHQSAAREAVVAAVGVGSPLLGAWGLVTLGPGWWFLGVAAIQALAVLPLLGAPDVPVKAEAPGVLRAAWPAALLMAADGWFDTSYLYIWQIALFVTLKQSFAAYGGAMALAGVVGAISALLIGPHIDAGHGRRAVVMAYGLAIVVTLARAASLGWPALAVAANAMGALLMPVLVPVLVTATSNRSKASPCPLRFSMATEGGWDVGCFVACLTAAAMFSLGAPFWTGLLLALPAAVAGGAILWRFYARPTLV